MNGKGKKLSISGNNRRIFKIVLALLLCIYFISTFSLLFSIHNNFLNYDHIQLSSSHGVEKKNESFELTPTISFENEEGYQEDKKKSIIQENKKHEIVEDNIEELCFFSEPNIPEAESLEIISRKIEVLDTKSIKNSIKILCIVYTNQKNGARLRAILNTWGKRCDKFIGASDMTDKISNSIKIVTNGTHKFTETGASWEKTKSVFAYVYAHYRLDYDYFHFCSDTTFLVVENLRHFLNSDEIQSVTQHGRLPFFTGNIIKPIGIGNSLLPRMKNSARVDLSFLHIHGGSGFTINKAALTKYVEISLNSCRLDEKAEGADLHLSACLWDLGIQPFETITKDGKDRYLHKVPENWINYWEQRTFWKEQFKWLAQEKGIPVKDSYDVIAKNAISFYGINSPSHMKTTNAIIYNINQKNCKKNVTQEPQLLYEVLDDNGNGGYIHDPYVLLKNPSSKFYLTNETSLRNFCLSPGFGEEGRAGYFKLIKNLQVGAEDKGNKKDRILCIVYTHEHNADMIKAITETYGQNCDGFLAASNITDISTGTVNILYQYTPESSDEKATWPKLKSIISYVYKNFRDDFDYFHISSDSAFLIVENLKLFLNSDKTQRDMEYGKRPLFAGNWMKPFWMKRTFLPHKDFYYSDSSPGYTMNKAALVLFAEKAMTNCKSAIDEQERDIYASMCFWKVGVRPYDTYENSGAIRYNYLSPEDLINYNHVNRRTDIFWKKQKEWLAEMRSTELEEKGLGTASNYSIAFPGIDTPLLMRRLYVIVHDIFKTMCSGYEYTSKIPFTEYEDPMPHPHPYAGALDENKKWGYVHNEKVLHESNDTKLSFKNETELREFCLLPGWSIEGKAGYQLISEKLKVMPVDVSTTKKTKLMCIIYTYEGNKHLVKGITETWAQKCDGFMAASTYTDRSTGTTHIPHLGTEGTYNSIWQKVRSIVAYIHKNFIDKYDYFYICGDDTFLIVENLKYFLNSFKVQNETNYGSLPLFAGGWISPLWIRARELPHKDFHYNGGGGGYILNRAAIKKFFSESFPYCKHNVDKSAEDLYMGMCLWDIGIRPFDTIDNRTGKGALRFNQESPDNLMTMGDFLFHKFWRRQIRWYKEAKGYIVEEGIGAVSNESVSFHRITKPLHMRRLQVLIYNEYTSYCKGYESTSNFFL